MRCNFYAYCQLFSVHPDSQMTFLFFSTWLNLPSQAILDNYSHFKAEILWTINWRCSHKLFATAGADFE